MGGRRSGASFEEGLYWDTLFDGRIADATAAGYVNCAEHLRALHGELMAAPVQ